MGQDRETERKGYREREMVTAVIGHEKRTDG
jgi:hypothetical protein